MDERLKQITYHKGIVAQLEQLIEESAELIVAIKKLQNESSAVNESSATALLAVAEAVAGVEIMIESIKYLLGIRDVVKKIKTAKIERTLKRIRREEEKNEKEESKVQSL